jgi:hypothetical protein
VCRTGWSSVNPSSVYNLLRKAVTAIADLTGLADFGVSRTLFDLIERISPWTQRKAVAAEPVPGRRFPRPGLAILSPSGSPAWWEPSFPDDTVSGSRPA